MDCSSFVVIIIDAGRGGHFFRGLHDYYYGGWIQGKGKGD